MSEVPYYYLSARAYAEQTGIGVAEVVKQFNSGNLEGFKTNGQYKIKVYKNGSVPYENYEKVLQENIELKTKLETIKSLV